MKAYKKVPWWWNVVILVIFTALSIVLVEVYNTELPVYGVFLALLIPAIYMVPCGLVQGITNVDTNQLVSLITIFRKSDTNFHPERPLRIHRMAFTSLSSIHQLTPPQGGYMFAGKPLANMVVRLPQSPHLAPSFTHPSLVQDPLRRRRIPRHLLRPRPETRPLLQNRAPHRLGRTGLRLHSRFLDSDGCDAVDVGEYRQRVQFRSGKGPKVPIPYCCRASRLMVLARPVTSHALMAGQFSPPA